MEVRKYLEWNDNECVKYQNSWGIANAVLRGKLIAIKCIELKRKRLKVSDLSVHLKNLS